MMYFDEEKFLILILSILLVYHLCLVLLVSHLGNLCASQDHEDGLIFFFLETFLLYLSRLYLYNGLEWILMYDVR